MTQILCPVYQQSNQNPNAIALVISDREYTYSRLHEVIASTVRSLQKAGVTKGSRVALIANNSLELVLVFWALMRIGAIACPVNPSFPTETIKGYLKKINARILYDPGEVMPDESGSERIEVVCTYNGTYRSEVTIDLSNDATIVATSGTSGTPKAGLHTVGNHYFSAIGSNQNIQLQQGDRWLFSLPLYHVSGMAILWRCWLAGAAVVVMNKGEDIGACVEQFVITHLSLVPTQLRRLLPTDSKLGCKHLKAVLVGGAPVPEELIKDALIQNMPLYTTYGLTELASQVCTTRTKDSREHLFTSGTLLSYREMRIRDSGEILVRGETLFRGYVDGDQVSAPVDADGWFHTGDIGCVDDNGYLTVAGRIDNMFISGGENIYPEEIERELIKVDGIIDVIVVPNEDRKFGQRPVAIIMLNGSHHVSGTEITKELATVLPRFKLPVAYYEWPSSPVAGGVKPSRSHVKELIAQGKATPLA